MTRSEINESHVRSAAFIGSFGALLPPFADWPPERPRSPEAALIRKRRLGRDTSDYGQGRFDALGRVLFTTRNGRLKDLTDNVFADPIDRFPRIDEETAPTRLLVSDCG